jgi:hypothetical protein
MLYPSLRNKAAATKRGEKAMGYNPMFETGIAMNVEWKQAEQGLLFGDALIWANWGEWDQSIPIWEDVSDWLEDQNPDYAESFRAKFAGPGAALFTRAVDAANQAEYDLELWRQDAEEVEHRLNMKIGQWKILHPEDFIPAEQPTELNIIRYDDDDDGDGDLAPGLLAALNLRWKETNAPPAAPAAPARPVGLFGAASAIAFAIAGLFARRNGWT